MTLECKKCPMHENCICISDADECAVRKQSYNAAVNDFAERLKTEYKTALSIPAIEKETAYSAISEVAKEMKLDYQKEESGE